MAKLTTVLVSVGLASVIAGGAFFYHQFKKNKTLSDYDAHTESRRFKTIYDKLDVIVDTDEATLSHERKALHIPDDEVDIDDDGRFLMKIENMDHTGHVTLRYRNVVVTIYYTHQDPTHFKDQDLVFLVNEMTERFYRELQIKLSTVLPTKFRLSIKRTLEFFLIS